MQKKLIGWLKKLNVLVFSQMLKIRSFIKSQGVSLTLSTGLIQRVYPKTKRVHFLHN